MTDKLPHAFYYASGYRPSGERAVRIDMLERLAGLVRTARTESKTREGFEATAQMMSLVGCSGEEFEAILRSLGFRKHMVKRKIETPAPVAPTDKAPDQTTEKTIVDASPADKVETTADAPTAAAEASAEDTASSPPQSEMAEDQNTPPSADAKAAPADDKPAEDKPAADKPGEVPEADGAPSEIEIALWRPAPRKPAHAQKRDGKFSGKPGERGKGKKAHPRKNDKTRAAGKPGVQRRRPPREKKADPNSPFAVLAGLKAELSNAEKEPKAKTPETAE